MLKTLAAVLVALPLVASAAEAKQPAPPPPPPPPSSFVVDFDHLIDRLNPEAVLPAEVIVPTVNDGRHFARVEGNVLNIRIVDLRDVKRARFQAQLVTLNTFDAEAAVLITLDGGLTWDCLGFSCNVKTVTGADGSFGSPLRPATEVFDIPEYQAVENAGIAFGWRPTIPENGWSAETWNNDFFPQVFNASVQFYYQ